MSIHQNISDNINSIQNDMFDFMTELYPICRSITGNGVRKTLEMIKKHINLTIQDIPSGTSVFDWKIPKEWNISDGYIIDPKGKKIVDFKKSNLHVVGYSIPIHKKIHFDELKNHIHTLPSQPNVIPFITSYYKETWGFCMSHNEFQKLESGEYEICIDSTLENGYLTFGEFIIKGKTEKEFLISCYVCHPSLCNDNLSGVVLATFLAKQLKNLSLNYSYRFLFIPETIGAITWLSLNEKNLHKIEAGLVATCLADSGTSTYKKSRIGNAKIDEIVPYVLEHSKTDFSIVDFYPYGSDERQFCSPGFNLPIGSLMRTPYRKFEEYHTSADDLMFIKKDSLGDSFNKYLETIMIFDHDAKYLNTNQKCEPQLGKRGLYRNLGFRRTDETSNDTEQQELAMFWILNLSDGNNSLFDIAKTSQIPFSTIDQVANLLNEKNLLTKII
jgi:aminopeptidase-like protein